MLALHKVPIMYANDFKQFHKIEVVTFDNDVGKAYYHTKVWQKNITHDVCFIKHLIFFELPMLLQSTSFVLETCLKLIEPNLE
jgi:hypothetical protein